MDVALAPAIQHELAQQAARRHMKAEDYAASLLVRNVEREARVRADMAAAARDPEFVKDLEETMADFEPLDDEAWRLIEDE
jgi:hypothetical protein